MSAAKGKANVPAKPGQGLLALIAALIAPRKARESPAEALRKAAILWTQAGKLADDYEALRSHGMSEIRKFLESKDTLEDWQEHQMLRIGVDGASPLLDYINQRLPSKLQIKTLRTVEKTIVLDDPKGWVDFDTVGYFIESRKSGENKARNSRRKRVPAKPDRK